LLCTIEKQKVPAKKEKKSENDKYYEMEGVVMYRSSMVQCFFQIHQAPAAQKKKTSGSYNCILFCLEWFSNFFIYWSSLACILPT
jgi:hypothetical protein